MDNTPLIGYVYVGADRDDPMSAAVVGAQIGSGVDQPPYIVVDHTLERTLLTRWPGQLWRVQALKLASDQPLAYARYTRATAVLVLEALPLSMLFEHQGDAVVDFLNGIRQLTSAQKIALAEAQDPIAHQLYNRVFDRWLTRMNPESLHLGQDHHGVIAMGGLNPRSPVGNASSVLYDELRKRACELEGAAALVLDEDGDECLHPQWHAAADTLQNALYGIAAPDALLNPEEREVLLRAYRAVVGEDG